MRILSIISTLTLVTVAASPVYAASTEWFVGAGVGYQEDSIKGRFDQNGEDGTYQLRGGAILNDHHRLMGTYSYIDKSSQDLLLASYDYLYPVSKRVDIYAGLSAGFADSKIQTTSSTDFAWGGQIGAIYEINNNWSTDLTYRYIDQNYEENDTSIDYSQQIILSVDYKF
ncbi:porin family protein [Photobacterium alginatilyticum]|uniref:Porin family protein n=1 Tax=Photobacterium alginatilyticum TaxID=1775171 RepID=A0ABW9YC02_9GAMM|nr:porin family protein [Photobacterium alginatilyticum]NBI51262.1 porin family protein [Photobacterium alginatilyticum]